MIKAGIVIDDWKLPIFQKRLSKAGFEYEQHPGVTPDTLLLTVMANSVSELEVVVRAANAEARGSAR